VAHAAAELVGFVDGVEVRSPQEVRAHLAMLGRQFIARYTTLTEQPSRSPYHLQQALGGKNLGVGKSGGAGMAYRPLQLLMAWGVLPPAQSVREPLMGTCGLIAGS